MILSGSDLRVFDLWGGGGGGGKRGGGGGGGGGPVAEVHSIRCEGSDRRHCESGYFHCDPSSLVSARFKRDGVWAG